ncbi:MAG: serine/threonine-protein kinase [Planctomycetaceae bacterium]
MEQSLRNLSHRFDRAWRAGKTPSIRTYLKRAIASQDTPVTRRAFKQLLTALVTIDLEQRWKCFAEGSDRKVPILTLEEYVTQFPQLGAVEELSTEILIAEFDARHRWGDSPPVDAYCQRFSDRETELRSELERVLQQLAMSRPRFPTIEGLEFLRKIDGGGFGIVYEAKHLATGRNVAVKVLRRHVERGSAEYHRFATEAKLVAKIQHPHIITLYDSGIDSSEPHLVMELLGGGTLAQWFRRESKRRTQGQATSEWQRRVVKVMLQVARGLVAAHAAKVVHRDLQPKNILFDTERRAKIVDFGLARLNDTQVNTETAGAGTRPYKSPEQFAAQKDVDHRSDIYSFGVVFFELLTGELPFSGTDLESRVANPDVAAPTARQIDSIVDRDLETICEKCLEKDAERRFQSANEIVDELKRYLKGIPILTRPLSRWERLHRIYIRPHRTIIALSAALLISVAVAITYQRLFRDSELNREQIVEENDQARTNLAATTQQLDSSRKVIEEQQETVVQEQALRSQAEERKGLIAYADDLQRVQTAWNESDPAKVSQLLSRHDPPRNGKTPDLRGVEWYYWKHLVSDSRQVLQNGGKCRCLAVDPAGEYLAATDFQNVTLWKLGDHTQVWKKVLVPEKLQFLSLDISTSWDGSAAFSLDGRYVAATGFLQRNPQRVGFLKVWEVNGGKEVLNISEEPSLCGRSVTFSPDSRFVIGGGYETEWIAWEVRNKRHRIVSQSNSPTRKAVSPPALGHPSNTTTFNIVSFLGFSDDGTRLFASCMGGANADSWKWSDVENESGGLRERIDPVDAGIVRVRSDGSVTVASISSADQKVHLLHQRPGASRPIIGIGAHARSVAMQDTFLSQPSPATCLDFRNGRLVAGGANRLVYAWFVQDTPVNVWDTEELRGHGSNITCVGQLPNGRPVSADQEGKIRIWYDPKPEAIDLESGSCLQEITEHQNHGNREIRIRNHNGTTSVIPMGKGESLLSSLLSDQEQFLGARDFQQ